MQFHAPVSVGDEVSVYAQIVKVGRTSMLIEVEAWRRGRHGEERQRVTQANFTFVAVGDDRKPRAVDG
jgi:acyl-CoA thioesterase YciA